MLTQLFTLVLAQHKCRHKTVGKVNGTNSPESRGWSRIRASRARARVVSAPAMNLREPPAIKPQEVPAASLWGRGRCPPTKKQRCRAAIFLSAPPSTFLRRWGVAKMPTLARCHRLRRRVRCRWGGTGGTRLGPRARVFFCHCFCSGLPFLVKERRAFDGKAWLIFWRGITSFLRQHAGLRIPVFATKRRLLQRVFCYQGCAAGITRLATF